MGKFKKFLAAISSAAVVMCAASLPAAAMESTEDGYYLDDSHIVTFANEERGFVLYDNGTIINKCAVNYSIEVVPAKGQQNITDTLSVPSKFDVSKGSNCYQIKAENETDFAELKDLVQEMFKEGKITKAKEIKSLMYDKVDMSVEMEVELKDSVSDINFSEFSGLEDAKITKCPTTKQCQKLTPNGLVKWTEELPTRYIISQSYSSLEDMLERLDIEKKLNEDPRIESATIYYMEECIINEDSQVTPIELEYSISKTTGDNELKDNLTLGDVDGNGKVDLYDVISIAKYVVNNSSLSADVIERADLNGDGTINVFDVIGIAASIAG